VTVEEHRRLGGDLTVDVPYKWLQFFLDDDARLASIADEYSSGRMLTGEGLKGWGGRAGADGLSCLHCLLNL